MLIPESLVWAMGGCTAVKVFCADDLREEIATRFTELFNENYEELMDLIEEEEGDCNEKEEGLNPFNGAQIKECGILLPFDGLAMYSGYGDFLACHDAGEALEKALKTLKEEYPSITYEGYVAYVWSDVHSGEVCQYEISSEKRRKNDKGEKIYDFVGEALGFALQDDEIWDKLAEELDGSDENDFKRIIKLFHMYSKWLPSDTIEKIISISEESDVDIKESLEEFAEAIKSGEDVEIEDEVDTSGLPDGYMEAMEMLMMAEEISGISPKRGEVVSSEGTFDIVIEKAEAGDPEAKFTAGKYFIADHIEEEMERAIRWIKEAAEANVEEAEEYIETHKDLFE